MTDLQSPLVPQMPISQGKVLYWEKLYGAAKGLAIVNAVMKQNSPVILITENNKAMESMLEEIQFFLDSNVSFPVLRFPDWEILPYDVFSPYQDIISERIKTLYQIINLNKGLIVTTATTVMSRLMPVEHLASRSMVFKENDELNLEGFKKQLLDYGYRSVSQVAEHGEYAFRGSILDVFPMGSDAPFRMDLLDNSIDSIRLFDTETQKSFSKINGINVLPANELDYTDNGIKRFRKNWRETFQNNPLKSEIYIDVSNKLSPQGIEFYLPLFFDSTSNIFEYFNNKPLILFESASIKAMHDHWQSIFRRYETAANELGRTAIRPDDLYVNPGELIESISDFSQIHIRTISSADQNDVAKYSTQVPLQLKIDARLPDPLGLFKKYLNEFDGKVLLVAESPGRRESLLALMKSNGLSPKLVNSWREFISGDFEFCLTVSPLENGASIDNPALAIISESQLFGERVYQRRLRKRRQSNTDALIRNLAELSIGDPVVHEENGVGRYKGLIELTINGIKNEFIHLEYDKEDKLYVPVSSLNLVSRYTSADPEHAPLHRLGSGQWQKIREKAEKRVFDVAAELLDLHAKRAARSGIPFTINQDEYNAFIQGFLFEETPDQEDAINAVLEDMKCPKAMDRLICGDAGFGKTEVAMRAAYVCVSNNKQVVLLVPTTLLAQQHYQNFKDRFADWPVKIEVMSRFVGKIEQKKIVENIENGKVDIIIGTHRLLQDDIKYKVNSTKTGCPVAPGPRPGPLFCLYGSCSLVMLPRLRPLNLSPQLFKFD